MKNGTFYVLRRVPIYERITQCHRHVMSYSNANILTRVWTVISTFTSEDKWDMFFSESTNAITVSRKTGF